MQFEESKKLQAERTELLAELEGSCSPEVVRKAEQIIERRRSILQIEEGGGSMVDWSRVAPASDSDSESQPSEEQIFRVRAVRADASPFDSIETLPT
jgi:hypothetical protein